MIEDDALSVQKLCYAIEQMRARELKLTRAQYRVSYYRKARAALGEQDHSPLPGGFRKWKNDPRGLEKQIEQARLDVLEIRGEYLAYRKRRTERLAKLLKQVGGGILTARGKISGLELGASRSGPQRGRVLSTTQITEQADQYVATVVLGRVFTRR